MLTAQPGEFVFDSSSIAYQKVMSGSTTVLINQGVGGSQTTQVALPAEYAAYSHLQMWATVTQVLMRNGSVIETLDATFDGFTSMSMKIVSGVLTFFCTSLQDTRVFAPTQYRFVANWAIFNARIDA